MCAIYFHFVNRSYIILVMLGVTVTFIFHIVFTYLLLWFMMSPVNKLSQFGFSEQIYHTVNRLRSFMSSCHYVIMSSCHHVIMSSCHHVIMCSKEICYYVTMHDEMKRRGTQRLPNAGTMHRTHSITTHFPNLDKTHAPAFMRACTNPPPSPTEDRRISNCFLQPNPF